MSSREKPLPCVICGFQPEAVNPSDDNKTQPYDAVECIAVGNYGSTELDNLFGHVRDFNICDKCYHERLDRMSEERVSNWIERGPTVTFGLNIYTRTKVARILRKNYGLSIDAAECAVEEINNLAVSPGFSQREQTVLKDVIKRLEELGETPRAGILRALLEIH